MESKIVSLKNVLVEHVTLNYTLCGGKSRARKGGQRRYIIVIYAWLSDNNCNFLKLLLSLNQA